MDVWNSDEEFLFNHDKCTVEVTPFVVTSRLCTHMVQICYGHNYLWLLQFKLSDLLCFSVDFFLLIYINNFIKSFFLMWNIFNFTLIKCKLFLYKVQNTNRKFHTSKGHKNGVGLRKMPAAPLSWSLNCYENCISRQMHHKMY